MTTGATTLPDAIRWAILGQLSNVHTCLPGQIVSYDYTTQKATIQPTLNRVWSDGTSVQLPVLEGVPVIFQQSGSASLTFPVNPGDTCAIFFTERSIDNWLMTGGLVDPPDPRRFNMSDAIAVMGLMPFNSTFPTRSNNTDAILQYAGTSITIANDGSLSINTNGGAFVTVDADGNLKIEGSSVKVQTGSSIAIGTPTVELIGQLITVFTALANPSSGLNGTARTACTAISVALTTIQGTLP